MGTGIDVLSFVIGKQNGTQPPEPVDLVDLDVTENGVYNHRGHDGYDVVTVEVEPNLIDDAVFTENGFFQHEDYDGYDDVFVNVPQGVFPEGTRNITENGTFDVSQYLNANVSVANPSTGTLEITVNGEYDVTNKAIAAVNVPINEVSGTIEITENGTFDVSSYAEAEIDVPTEENPPIGTILISQNGVYDVSAYANADVSLSNVIDPIADRGKVVTPSGTLVEQTSRNIVANGNYDTTTNDYIQVQVPTINVSGDRDIIENGYYDISSYAGVNVSVPNTYMPDEEGMIVHDGNLEPQWSARLTSNGRYDTTYYGDILVDVENTYTVKEEGYVVSDGRLVPQGYFGSITENGTYDTTYSGTVTVDVQNQATGTLNITENGLYPVSTYANANVNVPQVGIVPSGLIYLTDERVVDVYNYAQAQIYDPNLIPQNIKSGITILNVEGSYNPSSPIDTGEYIKFTYTGNKLTGALIHTERTSPQFNLREYHELKEVTYETDSMKRVPNYAFYYCLSLRDHSLPNGVEEIGNYAYGYCGQMYYGGVLPDTVKVIYSYAFYRCRSTPFRELPSSLITIGDYAFTGCWAADFSELPSSVTSIGKGAFNCSDTNHFRSLPTGVTVIPESCFYGNLAESFTFHNRITQIDSKAFGYNQKLTRIFFEGTPNSIAADAFKDCGVHALHPEDVQIYVPWREGDVDNAPWGATNATINYNWSPR